MRPVSGSEGSDRHESMESVSEVAVDGRQTHRRQSFQLTRGVPVVILNVSFDEKKTTSTFLLRIPLNETDVFLT